MRLKIPQAEICIATTFEVNAEPTPSSTHASLAASYLLRGDIMAEQEGRSADRLSFYSRAVELATIAYRSNARKYGARFRDAHRVIASYWETQGQWDSAVKHWEEVARPAKGGNAELTRMRLVHALVHTDRYEEALHMCETMLEQELQNPESYFHAARVFAAAANRKGNEAPSSRHLTHAIELLKLAARDGFFADDAARELLKAPEFDPLRDRKDFRTLLESRLDDDAKTAGPD